MPQTASEMEALLKAQRHDDVIESILADGPPCDAWHLAVLARAYKQRGDSRGDLYAAHFFAQRALQAGSDDAALPDIQDAYESRAPVDSSAEHTSATPPIPPETPYPFSALSVAEGEGTAPRDFRWSALNVPCQEACPAHTDIPSYLTAIFDGDYTAAYRINLDCNVFPGVLGRVCARPCESECRHGWDGLGESVAICHSKRAAADLRQAEDVVLDHWFEPSGKRIAVVGSGVAGLTAARELARWGHAVTVYERHNEPGGMMNQGIPEFRLPRDIIAKEIDQVRKLGVEIVCNREIGSATAIRDLRTGSDAFILAAGTLRPNLLDLPGSELDGVRHGLDFLLEANTCGTAEVGRHVVVIGGGFTAMDCARTAKRIGAATLVFEDDSSGTGHAGAIPCAPDDHVSVWYRRTEEEMLITPGELAALNEESIAMEFLVSPVRFIGDQKQVKAIEFIRTELGEPDESGRRSPVPIAGSEFQVPADTVLLATGQFPDATWIDEELRDELVDDDGWLRSGRAHSTSVAGVFVAGDFAQGASSLIDAIGHAKKTAREVDAYLMGAVRVVDGVRVEGGDETGRIREMDAVPAQAMPVCSLSVRDRRAEVETGYTNELATDEAQRCYRCHYKFEIDSDKCIYCDWCIKAKPRPDCIVRVCKHDYDDEGRIVGWSEATNSDDAYLIWINQDDCIRCGACVDACPVDAIHLQKVDRRTHPCSSACPTNEDAS